ncbi:hypothetical protein ACRXCV_12815 [Halobacteriovorax sp. GFR7]|uniref:hypothetical protein n=1 Tax=unclassified Halobacteriovorax TaxID=2639665 RepID=UPI003D996146
MKSLLLAVLFLTPSFSFAASENQLINTLENALRFEGYVVLDQVKENGEYTEVDFYVGAYGEERFTSCLLRNDQLVSCKDNWFKL